MLFSLLYSDISYVYRKNSDVYMTLNWRDGVPISQRFDDPYFSFNGGLAETEHVFINGNRLRERWCNLPTFHVAELGFGTGLNMLATWHAFRQDNPDGHLFFTSFERYPLSLSEMAQALEPFEEIQSELGQLKALKLRQGANELCAPGLTLKVIVGDANASILDWPWPEQEDANAWYLDGFSPVKNPELWNETLLREVARRTVSGGTFSTYSAAGWMRAIMASAGFTVSRVSGFGFKRHMSVGVKF